MSSFESTVKEESDKEKITNRLLELFDDIDDLKKLFNIVLPKNSLLKTILKIDSYTDHSKLCSVLVNYFGEHFFVYVSKIKSDEKDDKFHKTVVSNIRENILEKICSKHYDPELKRSEILEEFNSLHKNKSTTIHDMVCDQHFLSNHKWQQSLCKNILHLPLTVIARPDSSEKEPEITPLRKRPKLKRLYDYQTQALLEIQKLFSETEQDSRSQRRLLVNIPTGAGKTRLSVEAIVDWLNLRDSNRIPNAHPQQAHGRVVFWFASTNELCNQAAGEFENMYEQIGQGNITLTRIYGSNRRTLKEILDDVEGTHIVVTNTHHFTSFLDDETQLKCYDCNVEFSSEKDKKKHQEENKNHTVTRYTFDKYFESTYFKDIREQTIGIIIDEAHEITSESYQNLLQAMGFDFSTFRAQNSEKPIINRNNIALIGLTATAYKGSGIRSLWKCYNCNKEFTDENSKKKHQDSTGHTRIMQQTEDNVDELDGFVNYDKDNDPEYYNKLDKGTKKIHKTFGGVYVPLPHKGDVDSNPTAVIDLPKSAFVGDNVKISAMNSYDNSVRIKSYHWVITSSIPSFESINKYDIEFHYRFENEGNYLIHLYVTNEKGIQSERTENLIIRSIHGNKTNSSRTGSLEDNIEFYSVLEDRKILSHVTHGVITGPHLEMTNSTLEKERKKFDKKNSEKISNSEDYNLKICEIINKCIKNYGKKRILVFASSVRHSQELMMILKIKFELEVNSVDGTTNPGLRRKIIENFRNTEDDQAQVLCNYGVLTTGFDVPKIDTLLICRHTRSNALMTQMIGRGQRGETAKGTSDLWLITSNFLVSNNSDLKLGWEALASNWQKFDESVKNDLGIMDMPYDDDDDEFVKSNVPKPKTRKSNFILSPESEPIENLILKCQTCKVVSQGLDNCLTLYGYPTSKEGGSQFEDPAILLSALNADESSTNKFPRNCKFCRQIRKISKYSKCSFTKFLSDHHEFDPNIIFIMWSLNNIQKQKQRNIVHWDVLKKQLIRIYKTHLENSDKFIPEHYFSHTMDSMNKLVEHKIIQINNNLDIEFTPITENIEKVDEIFSILLKNKELTHNQFQKIVSKHGVKQKSSKTKSSSEIVFNKLHKELGHIPTRRQYNLAIDKGGQLDSPNYASLLKNTGHLNLKSDENLKDILYDEYFKKCILERRQITHEELDATGDYRLEDYREMWGSVEKFENDIKSVLNQVLTNYDVYSNQRSTEFEKISDDLNKLKKKRPASFYHFEEILQYSNLEPYRYVIQLHISHLRYLKNYHGASAGIFLQLVSDFFRLKEWIGCIPSEKEFIELTGPLTTTNFMKEFGGKSGYENFLKLISINISEISEQLDNTKNAKSIILEKLNELKIKKGKEEVINFITSPLNPDDELSVLIHKYHKNKTQLRVYFSTNH